MSERRYPNLIGVFQREFPIITGRVAGTDRREEVRWHGATYRVEGDPHGHGRYAFDVVLTS